MKFLLFKCTKSSVLSVLSSKFAAVAATMSTCHAAIDLADSTDSTDSDYLNHAPPPPDRFTECEDVLPAGSTEHDDIRLVQVAASSVVATPAVGAPAASAPSVGLDECEDRKPKASERLLVAADAQLARTLQESEKRAAARMLEPAPSVAFLPAFPSRSAANSPKSICFSVMGDPHTELRPAMTRKHSKVCNPSKPHEKQFAAAALAAMEEQLHSFDRDVPLRMDVEFRFSAGTNIFQKPDIDNLCKFVLDAMKGVLHHDGRQFVELHAVKGIADSPRSRTVVRVSATEIPRWFGDADSDSAKVK